MGMSVYWPLSVLCIFVSVFVCVIPNQSTNKKPQWVPDFNKLNSLLHKTYTKVLRLDMSRSIISLSKITHQMWRDHPFIQRNKTTERAVGWGLEVTGKGGLDKILKREIGNTRGEGVGVKTPLPTLP